MGMRERTRFQEPLSSPIVPEGGSRANQEKQVPTSRGTFQKIGDGPDPPGGISTAIGDAAKRLIRPRGIEGEQPKHNTVEPQTRPGTTERETPPPKAP